MAFFPMVSVVWFGEPNVNNRPQAFFRWPSLQNRRRAWGNSNEKRFTMAIPQEKAGIAPKLATPGRLGEIRIGNRLSWRSRFFPMALTPNPVTFDSRFGKNILKTVYYSDFLIRKRRSRQTRRPSTCGWGNSQGKPPMMATTLSCDRAHAKARDNPRDRVGKNSAEIANHSHFQEHPHLSWVILGIGETGEKSTACGDAKYRSKVGGAAEPWATFSSSKRNLLH